MGMVPGSGTARGVLAAVVIGVTAVTAGCGTTQAGQGGGAAGSPAAGPASASAAATPCSATPAASAEHMVSLSQDDNGKVLCVAKGTTVAIYLQGTAARRWSPISTASAALQRVVNGHLMLKLGVTGAFFKAVTPGVATVVSSLPSCSGQAGGTPSTSGPGCKMGTVFHLILVVTP